MNRGGDGELSTTGRFIAAAGASVVSAVVVNPFDVVKTRLQAQAAQQSGGGGASSALRGLAAECSPSCSGSVPGWHADSCGRFSSTVDGMQKIVRREGLRALWRGLDASLVMAVPAVGIYMPLYDILARQLQGSGLGSATPLAAGAAARMVAVLCTSPLELVRTRTQAVYRPQGLAGAASSGARGGSAATWSELSLAAGNLSGLARVQLLWRGVGATLARDVPFSAAYWGILEPIRRSMLPADGGAASPSRTVAANVTAGAVAGAAASALTQPLDVVKTRMQLAEGRSAGIWGTLSAVGRREGLRGLFAGVTPRAMKAAPACAIVLASYECLQLVVRESAAAAAAAAAAQEQG